MTDADFAIVIVFVAEGVVTLGLATLGLAWAYRRHRSRVRVPQARVVRR